jgi:N-acetylglucosaminyl-diphospho-decaprenol L-rhamnosyltransferase
MTNKDLTIVITTYKSEEKVEDCLNSVDPSIKVIVIENSNNKKFKADIENKFPNVECILTNDNLGYGRANNIGLKKVKTKYSLILNPDTVLRKETLNNFFIFLKKNINFAILGPSQNENSLELEDSNINCSNLLEVKSVKGFAMFLNMSKFSDIGFFDENFFLYLEEIDLCRRIKKNNEKIYIDENIKVFHYGGKSVDKIFSHEIELTRNWHWMWSSFYFNKKHFNYFYAFLIVLPKFFSAFLKSIFYKLIFKNKKSEIYKKRFSGLFNSIIGKPSWYRPTLD